MKIENYLKNRAKQAKVGIQRCPIWYLKHQVWPLSLSKTPKYSIEMPKLKI